MTTDNRFVVLFQQIVDGGIGRRFCVGSHEFCTLKGKGRPVAQGDDLGLATLLAAHDESLAPGSADAQPKSIATPHHEVGGALS